MENPGLISEVALCIVVAWLLALAARLIRQPLIIAYLAAGLLVGPVGLGWINSAESISRISELGLIFLLFMIGLEIDLKKILRAGRAILLTSLAQMLGGTLLGFVFFKVLNPLPGGGLTAIYLAVSAALSSTVIIVKLLYDKGELDTLGGRITLGVLVLQDLFAILFLAIQPSLTAPAAGPMLGSLFRVVVLVASTLVASRYVLPALFRAVARQPELVLVGALAWCFLVCGLAQQLNLSREMGALIAGVALSTFPYALDVAARVTTLRDFFLTLFFVGLGMSIPRPTAALLIGAGVYSLFLVASRFLTVFTPLYAMRLGHRTSLVPSINLCQVSEFSLVIVSLGAGAGHLSPAVTGVVAYAFVLLAVASSYAIGRNDALVRWLSPGLRRCGLPDLDAAAAAAPDPGAPAARPIQMLGFFWTASSLLEELGQSAPELLREISVLDFNPEVNTELRRRGIPVLYGDISQRDTLRHSGIERAAIVLCTIPNSLLKGTTATRLVREIRELNAGAQIIVTAQHFAEARGLYQAGADYVLVPRLIEARELSAVLQAARHGSLSELRRQSEGALAARREVLR